VEEGKGARSEEGNGSRPIEGNRARVALALKQAKVPWVFARC
jgi:hypothetical protein